MSQEIDPARGKPVPPELQSYYRPGSSGKMSAGVLWADHFRNSPQFQKYVAERQNRLRMPGAGGQGRAAPARRSKDSFLRQTLILARRQFDLIRFDWRTLFILLALMPLIGALFAMVNKEDALVGRPGTVTQIEADLTAELEKDGLVLDEKIDYLPSVDAELLLAMMALALTQAGTFSAAYEIVKERAIFKRERAVNLKVTSYVFSKMFILAMFSLFQVGAFMLVIAAKVDMGFKGAIFEYRLRGAVYLPVSGGSGEYCLRSVHLFYCSEPGCRPVRNPGAAFRTNRFERHDVPAGKQPGFVGCAGILGYSVCRIDSRYTGFKRRRPVLFGAGNTEYANGREGIESDL